MPGAFSGQVWLPGRAPVLSALLPLVALMDTWQKFIFKGGNQLPTAVPPSGAAGAGCTGCKSRWTAQDTSLLFGAPSGPSNSLLLLTIAFLSLAGEDTGSAPGES